MRRPLVLASLLFVTPAMAEHVELAFEASGFVTGLRYFGSKGWQSSETIINFKHNDDEVTVKCGSVINTEFRISATVDQAHVDEFIGRYNDLLYAYLHGASIQMTVVCKDNLPEVTRTSVQT